MALELRRMREKGRSVAAGLAVVLLTGSSSLAHRLAADDVACVVGAIAGHDASAHRIEAVNGAPRRAGHCAICHWLRDLRPLATTAKRLGANGQCRGALEPTAVDRYTGLRFPAVPARAPPA